MQLQRTFYAGRDRAVLLDDTGDEAVVQKNIYHSDATKLCDT